MKIRYLTEQEKEKTKTLYHLCFPEDSERFVSYYYKEKCKDNRIAVIEEENELVTMIHLNPFVVSLCENPLRVSYLVAVATHPQWRKGGRMNTLLGKVLRDCYQRREAFSFLMPADPAYYLTSGYRWWKNQKIPVFREEARKVYQIRDLEDREWKMAAACANDILAESYDLYICRNAEYYRRMALECASEGGNVAAAWKDNILTGLYCYTTDGGMEIREPLFPRNVCDSRIHPQMMGRIVHLKTFVESLYLDEPFEDVIRLSDPVIPENNGVFRICINEEGGKIEKVKSTEMRTSMDIADLGQLLFDRLRICINEQV